MTNVLIKTYDRANILGKTETVKEVFELDARHYDGKYRVSVMKVELTRNCRSYQICADGNFNVTLCEGRKSKKKLEKIESYLEDNKQKLYDLWKDGKYQAVARDLWNFSDSL